MLNFIRYLETEHGEIGCFSELERSQIESWFRHLARTTSRRGGPLRPATKNGYVTRIRCFLEALTDWGWPEAPSQDLIQAGDAPPLDQHLPKALSRETDQALQEELKAKGGLLADALLLLRWTGMRIGELLNLEVDALQTFPDQQWSIKVPLGKLHSERCIPVDRATVEVYQEILRLRESAPPCPHPESGKPTEFLLLWPDGRRPHRNGLYNALQRAAKRARVQDKVWPHRLRHTFATEMLRAGMSLPVLMKILGHRSMEMTLRYLHVTTGDTRKSYFESMESVKRRYELPEPPEHLIAGGDQPRQPSIGPDLSVIAAQVEGFRRDLAPSPTKKKLQRLVQRLRRLASDLEQLGL